MTPKKPKSKQPHPDNALPMMTLPRFWVISATILFAISGHSFGTTLIDQSNLETFAFEPSKDQSSSQNALDCYEANNEVVHRGFDSQFLKFNCIEAKKGNARAQHNVGQVYFLSEGVGDPNPGSLKWFSKAAAQGLPNAQYALAILYIDDRAVVGDFEKAEQWMLKAAENGQVDAQYWLGIGFGRIGTQKESEKMNRSFQWLRKAVAKNHILAKEVLTNICAKASSTFKSSENNATANPFSLTQTDCPGGNTETHISEPGERPEKELESKIFPFKESNHFQPYIKNDLEKAIQTDLLKYIGMMGTNFSVFATRQGAGFMKF